MVELARITQHDIMALPRGHGGDLSVLLMGKHILNNPKAVRRIVFYEVV